MRVTDRKTGGPLREGKGGGLHRRTVQFTMALFANRTRREGLRAVSIAAGFCHGQNTSIGRGPYNSLRAWAATGLLHEERVSTRGGRPTRICWLDPEDFK